MNEDIKTWIVEPGDVLDVMEPEKKQPDTPVARRAPSSPTNPIPRPAPVETIRRRAKTTVAKSSGLQFAHLAVLTYLLGPLAILLTPRGRRQQSALVLAGMSIMATAALVWAGFGGLVRPDHPASVWAWLALVGIAVGGGFTAWARAVHLLGREGLPRVNQLPYWLRRKWSVSLLGLVAPGSGMLLGGRSGLAAVTLWLLGPVVAAVVILLNVMGLWHHHLGSGWLAADGPALEKALMVAAGVAALGFLGYIAQALQGVRQVLVEPGLQTRVKGDYYAVAVLAAVVVMVVAVDPARMARQIDLGGNILQTEGFQEIPLRMTLLAEHLDPGQPEYALQAIALYRELGNEEQAAAVRADLDRNLSTYVALVQKETVAEFSLVEAGKAAKTKPRPAEVKPVKTRQTAAEMDPAWTVGALMKQDKAGAVPDTVAARPEVSASKSLGMPIGPGLTANDSTPAPTRTLGPEHREVED